MRDVLKALETSEAEHAEAAGCGGARVLEAVSSSRKALGFSPGQEVVGKSDRLDDWIEVSSHKFGSCEESVDDLEKSYIIHMFAQYMYIFLDFLPKMIMMVQSCRKFTSSNSCFHDFPHKCPCFNCWFPTHPGKSVEPRPLQPFNL